MDCGCCVVGAPRAAGASATWLGVLRVLGRVSQDRRSDVKSSRKNQAGKDSIFQYKLGPEETLPYQRTGAGVNLMMIKPISFLLNTEKEADGRVQHCFLIFF